nr:MAG TPA: hypothetical protein [Caudoviricetes sp.]
MPIRHRPHDSELSPRYTRHTRAIKRLESPVNSNAE